MVLLFECQVSQWNTFHDSVELTEEMKQFFFYTDTETPHDDTVCTTGSSSSAPFLFKWHVAQHFINNKTNVLFLLMFLSPVLSLLLSYGTRSSGIPVSFQYFPIWDRSTGLVIGDLNPPSLGLGGQILTLEVMISVLIKCDSELGGPHACTSQ
jgi:hypothetical protein